MRRHLILFVAAAGLTGLLTLAPAQETLAVTYGWNNNNGNYTYIEENGSVHKGWIHTTDGYYYMDLSSGLMTRGWKQIDGKWYYFKANGLMATQWQQVDNKWYYLYDTTGVMVTGWLKIRNNNDYNYYYLKSDGSMATGWREMDNAWYYFRNDGRCVVNSWYQIGGQWYFFDSSGKMATGWQQINGSYYCLNTDGRMLTGWQTDGTNRYYLDVSTGKMAQGWTLINNAYYYFNESGHMATGWIQINGQYFYLDPSNGTMYANTSITLNGVTYTFGANGVCQNVGNQNTAPGSGSGRHNLSPHSCDFIERPCELGRVDDKAGDAARAQPRYNSTAHTHANIGQIVDKPGGGIGQRTCELGLLARPVEPCIDGVEVFLCFLLISKGLDGFISADDLLGVAVEFAYQHLRPGKVFCTRSRHHIRHNKIQRRHKNDDDCDRHALTEHKQQGAHNDDDPIKQLGNPL